MAIFQKSVLNQYLKQLDKNEVANAYSLFKNHFHNATIQQHIRNSKEEQYQGEFLIDLFVNVLGYTKNPQPNFNLQTEQKNETDSKKADGAILKDGNVIAVIELKGTNTTDLSTVVTQAFGYKNNQKNCKYIIISNFEKLRFYIDNAIDFEEFNLFNLSAEKFELLYLCLHYNNLSTDVPEKIKLASTVKEQDVTKQLYKDYSEFKRKLFTDIVQLNPTYDKLILFKKSQKLLDRILFILFAEDRGLLQANTIQSILDDFEKLKKLNAYFPLYDLFKKHFTYLNTGFKNENYDVFGYNGGLFAPDEILDNITISDNLLLNYTPTLAKYDYETDVDVNILGHIFEHSLNDIEEIQAELDGTAIDKTKTKRKKDGVFYTPKYITKYIVENTVGALCTEKRNEYGIVEDNYTPDKRKAKKKELLEKLDNYQNWLLHITIVDPACGSGAFLNQALEFLIQEHKNIDELRAQLLGESMVLPDHEVAILENNIFGVDLNEESVEIARLSLWLRTAQKGRKLNSLNNNIKCGNSLIDDKEIAGEKAFNWQTEFPQIFNTSLRGTKQSGFDVVIGNPPYVRQELLGDYKEYFSSKFNVFNFSSDLFAYFYEKGLNLLNPNGYFGFISNTFDKTTAGIDLRKYLKKHIQFKKYIDFTEVQIFHGATTYPIILIAKKKHLEDNLFEFIKIPNKANTIALFIDSYESTIVKQTLLEDNNWSFKSDIANNLLEKISKNKTIREQFGKCFYGIKTALNEAFIINENIERNEHIKPIYEGKEINKWNTLPPTQSLILFKSKWTKNKYGNDITEQQALGFLKTNYSNLIQYLLPFEEKAKKRFDKGGFWWELRNCAYYDLFDKPKIIFPNLQNKNKFCYDEQGNFINAPAVFLPTNNKALVSILNSKLVWYFLKTICVIRSGGYIEVKPQYFEQIPIPNITDSYHLELSKKAEIMLTKSKELQTIKSNFIKLLQSRYSTININTKLSKWNELSFKDFCKELEKQKIKLSISEQAELMQYFEQEQTKANNIQQTISQTDKEIDTMVYKLYELSDEEIKIIEK